MSADLDLRAYALDDDAALWVEAFVRRLADGKPVPLYGSPEWQDAHDRLRIASAVRAGEAWRRAGLTLQRDLSDEIARGGQWLDGEQEDAFAAACGRLAQQPTRAELVERRAA